MRESTKATLWYAKWTGVVVLIACVVGFFIWSLVNLASWPSHVPAGDVAQVRLYEQLARQTVELGTQPGSSPETGFQARLKALQDDYQACSLLESDKAAGYSVVPRDISMFERQHCNGNP